MADNEDAAAIITRHLKNGDGHAEGDDWQQLPEIITAKELLDGSLTSERLPWFPKGHSWKTKKEYLEALYLILRFEGSEGLRYSIKCFKQDTEMMDDDDTCIYTKVRVEGYLFTKMGPAARISFSTQRANARIKWNQSKRLQAGRIVALSHDGFANDCRVAVVAQRPIEGGLDQNPPTIDIFWAQAEDAVIDPEQEFTMVESRNGYYEACRHALKGLQLAADESSAFDKYVVLGEKSDRDCQGPTTFDLSSLVHHLSPEQVAQAQGDKAVQQRIFEENERLLRHCVTGAASILKIKQYTTLDDSQLEALQRILSKELAMVQGPPGTGKTFTSVQSLKAMLRNRQPDDPPILVAAQTNHALDQLLIYCRAAGAKIMRIGGRTENNGIAERTMYELRKMAPNLPRGEYIASEVKRNEIVDRFLVLTQRVFGGDSGRLVGLADLLEAGAITQEQHDSMTDDSWEDDDDTCTLEDWLGTEKIQVSYERVDDVFDHQEMEADDETIELDDNLEGTQKVDDDDDRIYGRYIRLRSGFTGKKPRIVKWKSKCEEMLARTANLWKIPPGYRGGVYSLLQSNLRNSSKLEFRQILQEAVQQARDHKQARWLRDLSVIGHHEIEIVGCTTTGLSKYRGYLAAMKPRILMIEEAAETREANIAAALFPSLHQLVLVGDHQQLPPSCDVLRLGQHPFNLNVSMFERLVEYLPYTMLDCQRRMAPELSFILQKFYPKLRNHPIVTDVAKRPFVPGLGDRRSWFLTHEWPEETDTDNSKYNQQEVEIVAAFVRYLLHNHVKASEITILTYYKGQKRRLIKRLHQSDIPPGHYFNVATVDSYQGEENEIVILSLVRSPQPGHFFNIGFLESRNRATVAISRARRGFFMFGNKRNLLESTQESFNTWARVWNGFSEQDRVAMSKGMPLVCQNHGNQIWVKDAEDLVGNAGGCRIKCAGKLGCGHDCTLPCHNVTHEKLACTQPCSNVLSCGHKCVGSCTDPCECFERCIRRRHVPRLKQAPALPKQLTKLQIANHDKPSRKAPDTAPDKWQEMSRNIKAHDAAFRERRTNRVDKLSTAQSLPKRNTQKFSQTIQDTFVPVKSVDGCRIMGQSHQVETKFEWHETSGSIGGQDERRSAPSTKAPELLISLGDSEDESAEVSEASVDDEIDAFTPLRINAEKAGTEYRAESQNVATDADLEEDLIEFEL
ncbi:P-loop containing nucleoside triphosphate hydrolase protein [Coniella lustricola]|uniref:P-loop containing nucleoside triphosphate hydrolase protein n=1 Tax=Coniella lustricola TaxID=2025994 RepID=A0A2T3A051_9PEZI|nr:P-loop containing nucleoside triphosphate hydrolase protein [Coniella lustricola]